MIKSILNIEGVTELKKRAQQGIKGGTNCTVYTAGECAFCDGLHLPNGCCVVDEEGQRCLDGGIGG
jgi:hypothetical protein